MRILSTLLFCLVIWNSGYSQDNTSSIADYKLPEINYHGLNFDFYANGHYNDNNVDVNYSNRALSRINMRLLLSYFRQSSNDKLQQSNLISLVSTPFHRFSNNDQTQTNTNTNLRYQSNKRYYKPTNKFWGYDINASVFHSYSSIEQSNNNIKYHTIHSYVQLPIFIGIGRIEEVTDIWYAKRILEQLERREILSRSFDDQDLLDLANEISAVRHDRVYDRRLDQIADIKILDSWLQYTNLIKYSGSDYFTTLIDYYNNGAQSSRYSGKRFTVGVAPYLRMDNNIRSEFEGELQKAGYMFTRYDRFTPINDDWQFDINALLLGGYMTKNTDTDDGKFSRDGFVAGGHINLSLAYYPTSRISYITSLNGLVQLSDIGMYIDSSLPSDNYVNHALQLNQLINYYISHRTSINFNIRMGVSSQENGYFSPLLEGTTFPLRYHTRIPNISYYFNTSKFYSSFYIGFNHAIF